MIENRLTELLERYSHATLAVIEDAGPLPTLPHMRGNVARGRLRNFQRRHGASAVFAPTLPSAAGGGR